MDPAAHHRKIELQSSEDFAYLVDNVRRAAAESVSAAFPPVEDDTGDGEGDDLHARVEGMVDEYIRRTFLLAAPNLTINGLPVKPEPFLDRALDGTENSAATAAAAQEEPSVEPFDPRRRQRVEALAREEEDLLRVLAQLKRQLPAKAVAARAAAVDGALVADDTAQAQATAAVAQAWEDDDAIRLGAVGDLTEPATAYATAVAGLGHVKQEMPATVARMERARVAGQYAQGEQ